jgi:iron complex outermembrane receptor protein
MMTWQASTDLRNYLCVTIVVSVLLFAATAGAQESGTVRGIVTSEATGAPLADATVICVESDDLVVTGADGTYVIELPAGAQTLTVFAEGYDSLEQRVMVTGGETFTANFVLRENLLRTQDTIVVLGSRVGRSAVETAVPVDVLPLEDLTSTGMSETSRMIQFLAPSFNFQTSTISDGTDIVRPSTLRGLGPDQTLVLVNGKRRHNSSLIHVNGSIGRGTAGVDLNAIPAGAIERVEILRDGAAAQYGSDAIAGVINVILKKKPEQTDVTLSAGQHYEGDGEVLQAAVNHGWEVGEDGFINLTAEYRDRGFTNRAGPDPRQIYRSLADGSDDPRESTYDRMNHRYGDAASQNSFLFLNSEIPISSGTTIYFFGGAAQRDGESAGFNRLPIQSRTNVHLHPDGHLPLINTDVDDASLAAGLRKSFSRWAVDASVTHGYNVFNFFISNSANTSMGPDSPTSADAGTLSFAQTTVNLDLYGTVNWGLASPVSLAFGAELRRDQYEIEAGEPASWIDGGYPDQYGGRAPAGIQVFPGFRPANEVDESRSNLAAYGDLELNLAESFLLGVAARYESYSDFGDSLSGKVAGRYELVPRFAIRGSVSTGFRAPSLHQSYFNNISTQFVDVQGVLTPLEVGTFRVDSDVARALGATDLNEETSFGYTIGFTAQPTDNLSISADVFSIAIDDRIVISGRFAASNPQIALLLEPFGVNAAQFFTNAIDTDTEGVDVVVSWAKRIGTESTLSLTAAASWNQTEVVGDVRTPPQLGGLGETLFPLIDRTYMERGQPQELYNLAGRLTTGPFSAMLRFNKFGAVASTESNSDPTAFQVFSGKWLTDLDLSYSFGNGISVAIGANNLLDVYPDKNIDRNSFNGIFVYPRRVAPFGFNGGYYYTRLKVRL